MMRCVCFLLDADHLIAFGYRKQIETTFRRFENAQLYNRGNTTVYLRIVPIFFI